MTTILGIDPGLNATGYGVIAASSNRMQLVHAGVIRPSARRSLAQRVLTLYEQLTDVIQSTQPALTVLESLFTHARYLTTAALMAHARSVAMLVSAQHGLPVVEYLPTRIKKALTGYGAASKDQVARAVEVWLGVRGAAWASDTSDALALALAHAHITRIDGMMAPQRLGRGRRPALPPALAEAIEQQR